MAKREVLIGQSYQPMGQTYMARPAPCWRVTEIFTSYDGLRYAKMLHEGDRTLSKTMSVMALGDPRLFQLRDV